MDSHATYKQWSIKFVPGKDYSMHVQVWLTEAMFAVVKQARFDYYAFKFKGDKDYHALPLDLQKAIQQTFVALFNPVQKDFRTAAKTDTKLSPG